MGANSSKKDVKHPLLSEEESSHMISLFRTNSGQQAGLTEKNLVGLWNGQMEESLLQLFAKYFFRSEKFISFQTFIQPYLCVLHGSMDEKTRFLTALLTGDERMQEIPIKAIVDYVYKIISSYILQMKISNSKELLSWATAKFEVKDEGVKLFAEYLCQDLSKTSGTVGFDELEKWMTTWSRVATMEKYVYRSLYGLRPDEIEEHREVKLIPRCVMLPRLMALPSILDISSIICLTSALPIDMRDQWRLLFSTAVHGESFAKLLGHITDKGSTMLIIEDKEQHVFGGFAPDSWKLGPKFIGDERSFLFTLRPTVNVYFPSSYNDHYQYLNLQQQTFPNGLGMGGQLQYFGLWLDAEFGLGHCSESCTTYRNYKMLSGSKQFQINHLEVWGIGPEPVKEEGEEAPRKGILDADLQARALLEIAGKTYHSDGYRNPEEEEEEVK